MIERAFITQVIEDLSSFRNVQLGASWEGYVIEQIRRVTRFSWEYYFYREPQIHNMYTNSLPFPLPPPHYHPDCDRSVCLWDQSPLLQAAAQS